MQPEGKKISVGVIGGGLVGSLMACYLAKSQRFDVELIERQSDIRKVVSAAGRSINLAMSTRALTALKELGMADQVLKLTIPMTGRMMHSKTGEKSYQQYSSDGKTSIYSVSRSILNQELITAAQKMGAKIKFDHKLTRLDYKSGETVFDVGSGQTRTYKFDTIMGADGAFSITRSNMLRSLTHRIDYSQEFLKYGYKELSIPPNEDGTHQMEINCLHIWPRGTFMMIALPNLDGSFTCTIFLPFEDFESIDASGDEGVTKYFQEHFSDAEKLMPTLQRDWKENPTSSMVTVKCNPWSINDKVTLLGDAAHAVVPFFGQGMNCGFEDCTIINSLIEKHLSSGDAKLDLAKVYREYQESRIPNSNAIANMAVQNFIEMRDKTGDPKFLFRKVVENTLGKNFPDIYKSRYELISFTTTPYSEAERIGKINDSILDELIDGGGKHVDRIEDIDLVRAKELVWERLKK